MDTRKGLSSTMKIGWILIIAVIIVAGMVGGAALFMQGSVVNDSSDDPSKTGGDVAEARWDERQVKYNVKLENLASDTITSGTLHYWREKPEN